MPHATARRFARYVGIDYSGAQTPTSSLKGLRVYTSEAGAEPNELLPPVALGCVTAPTSGIFDDALYADVPLPSVFGNSLANV
jgi:hypothetical protein